jgi:serine/threonine protein kinase/Flp pilus assembly protein TadD
MTESLKRRSSAATGPDPVLAELIEELTNKLHAGEPVDLDAYAAAYPDQAQGLRDLLPALQVLASLSGSAAPGGGAEPPCPNGPSLEAGTLGDFRIIREIGRGGMGLVYEAEQISLGRRVALKVLPFAGAMDPRQLQRFQNEARAAAGLHHTNIVPVYAVGCERGVHFYAMQLIDGHPLTSVVQQLRQAKQGEQAPEPGSAGPARDGGTDPPAPATATAPHPVLTRDGSAESPAYLRAVARLGVQAAEALEYAHLRGVVHRDVKPSNLLLDGQGNLWVTDFGLARLPNDAGLTLTGDLVGTLRYMSPEQATAKQVAVDHRTDLYSLGVTLYELLTLEPAFAAADHHELLCQIAWAEPRPPRRLNPALPVDLETIVLKAMEKDAADRYATAQELVDDLRRFLEDRPIRARRPTVTQRAVKWARRHRAFVVAAAVVLVLTTLAALACTLLVWREKLRADEERDRARGAASVADAALRSEAEQRRRAEARTRFARQAAETYAQIAEKVLANRPHMEREERKLLERVLDFYQELAREDGSDPVIRMETGRAYRRVGNIQQKLGRHEEAEKAYRRSLALLEPLPDQSPAGPLFQYELAGTLNNLGGLLLTTGRPGAAEKPLRRSLALCEKLRDRFADGPSGELLEAMLRAGPAGESGEGSRRSPARDAKLVNECSKAFRNRLAGAHSNLGLVLAATGRPAEAEQAYQEALALQEKLVAEDPAGPDNRYTLASGHFNHGELLRTAGRHARAKKAYGRALALFEKLAAESPATPAYRESLAKVRYGLGTALADTSRLDEAESSFRQAAELQQKLAADFPSWPEYRYGLALSQNNLGIVLQATRGPAEAEEAFRRSLALLKKLAEAHPAVPDYRHQLARTAFNLGSLLEITGRPREAEKPLRLAQALYEKLAAGSPSDVRPEQAGNLNSLALVLKKTGRAPEAEQAYRQAIAVWEKLADEFPRGLNYQANLGGTLAGLARLLSEQGQWAQARPQVEQAVRLQQAVLEKDPEHPAYRRLLRSHYLLLAETLQKLGQPDEADRARARAAALQKASG